MTKYLIDTHIYIWAEEEPHKLSQAIQAILANPDNEVYLSMASLWEMQIKVQLGKLTLKTPLQQAYEAIVRDNLYQILPIEPKHLWQLEGLVFIHKDPFDRLLIAQCVSENLTFLTVDENIIQYPINYIS